MIPSGKLTVDVPSQEYSRGQLIIQSDSSCQRLPLLRLPLSSWQSLFPPRIWSSKVTPRPNLLSSNLIQYQYPKNVLCLPCGNGLKAIAQWVHWGQRVHIRIRSPGSSGWTVSEAQTMVTRVICRDNATRMLSSSQVARWCLGYPSFSLPCLPQVPTSQKERHVWLGRQECFSYPSVTLGYGSTEKSVIKAEIKACILDLGHNCGFWLYSLPPIPTRKRWFHKSHKRHLLIRD